MFTKLFFIFMLIYICTASTQFYYIFCAVFKVFCTSVSVKYNLLYYVFLYKCPKNSLEKLKQMSKSGFFLSQSYIGGDFQAKSEESRQNQDG